MLRRRKRLFWFGAALFVLGGAFLVLPPYAEYCEGDYANNYYCSAYEVTVALGGLLDAHNGRVIAIFTIILAGSTIGLWYVTQQSARIAERALTDLEAPVIGLKIVDTGLLVIRSGDEISVSERRDALVYRFVNYGRTPAILLNRKDKLQVCKKGDLPTREWAADRNKTYPYGVLIGPGKKSDTSRRLFKEYTSEDEMLGVIDGGNTLFLIGILQYRDVFKKNFEMGFCAAFNREAGRFLMEGYEAYNYCRPIT
jgi:hypothetical protein